MICHSDADYNKQKVKQISYLIMKKSSTNSKDILKKRTAKKLLIKLSQVEQNVVNKENRTPKLLNSVQNKKIKNQDRKLENEYNRNPFYLPTHLRTFKFKNNPRKLKPQPYIMSEPRTICDIDNKFYKVIEGRPVRQFTDVKVYMSNIRDITLTKANAAYLKDQIIQIDTSFDDEVKEYDRIANLFANLRIHFAHFVKDSYIEAKAIQIKTEATSLELTKKIDQLEAYSFEYVKIRNMISNRTASFETLTMYRKFLNSISPNEWRKKYDNFINCSSLFPRAEEVEEFTSPSDLSINIYKSSIAQLQRVEPRLYFKKPVELMKVYDKLQKQCLNYMEIQVFSNNILTSILRSKDYLKVNITAEINELIDLIDTYKDHIIWIEDREHECKALFEKLVRDTIESLYASYEVTKLFTCLQYVSTRLFDSPEDPKDNISFLITHMESLYIELTSGLDCLDQDIIKEATREAFTQDIKMMKQAHVAQRNIKECDILSKALYKSFEPPRYKHK